MKTIFLAIVALALIDGSGYSAWPPKDQPMTSQLEISK